MTDQIEKPNPPRSAASAKLIVPKPNPPSSLAQMVLCHDAIATSLIKTCLAQVPNVELLKLAETKDLEKYIAKCEAELGKLRLILDARRKENTPQDNPG